MYAYCAAVASRLSTAQQATLWALASFVNNGTSETFVSIATLAKRMGLHPNRVRGWAHDLVAAGIISATVRAGATTLWRFPVHPALSTASTRSGTTRSGASTQSGTTPNGSNLHPIRTPTSTRSGGQTVFLTNELMRDEPVDNSEDGSIGIEEVEVSEEMPAWLVERIQARKLEAPRMMWEVDFDRTVAADG